MKIKEKFIKQKQLTDRPQTLKNTDSTPLLARLEKQYLFNQPNPQKTERDHHFRGGDKQNFSSMVNSASSNNEYLSHNVIKIDNYEGKRFKTHQGYEPMMTKSRYMLEKDQNEQPPENSSVYQSSENIVLRRDKPKKIEQRIYESVDLSESQRPLTFGLVRKTEPMKSSIEYKEDTKMKNQILDQMSGLRKSQETLYGSKDYSATGFQNVIRCINHHNKKAKYKLLAQAEPRDDEQMVYCSKCAINLLQQGFKVEQMKPGLMKKMTKSQNHLISSNHMISSAGAPSRIQQMKNFQQKLNEVQQKISKSLQQSSLKTGEIQQIERQVWQTECVYDQMIEHLHKMKEQQIYELNEKKQKKIVNLQRHQKEMKDELQSIMEMKKEMKQFRNKFIIMKENQFQFLISSFLNKIQSYGNKFKETQRSCKKIEDQIDQIIIGLCQYCKNIKEIDQSRFTNKKTTENSHNQSEDDFICKEIKGPFRTLFPEEDANCLEVIRQQDSPSFNRQQQPSKMMRSIRHNEMIRNQYY